ncbi:MAG: hydroxyacid dehydrogenase [Peptoanaerobacter stomatis]|uniref:hydroxyacid dehydrogenase n=1 Tax=Peptoanaerobacter stomatis TaxID=796937 RepID=UPI003FA14BCE
MKCLVTELFNQSGIDVFEKNGVEVTLAYGKSIPEITDMVKDYEILVVRAETPVQKPMIDAGVKLKAIGMAGIGLNHIDVEYAKSKGIAVFNVPDGSTTAVSELAIGTMLNVLRKIGNANNFVKAGNWNKTGFTGNEIKNKTVGILSLGRIGFRVAEICLAFGAKEIVTYDPYLKQEVADKIGARILPLDEVLKVADIVSIHTPLTPETKHMIGKEQLSLMKDGSFLFNLGRGGIVDEEALYDALTSGKLAGAGFDVMEQEPPAKDNKLFKLDNFSITCHIGAGTKEAQIYIADSLANQIMNYINK